MSEVMCGTLNDIEIERLAESGELIWSSVKISDSKFLNNS